MMGKSQKEDDIRLLSSLSLLLDFLTTADATNGLSCNVGKGLTTQHCIISQNSRDLTWWFGNAGHGLASRSSSEQSSEAWCSSALHTLL